jgi:hypothetical protein
MRFQYLRTPTSNAIFPLFGYSYPTAIMGAKWYLIFLICISLMSNDIEELFMCLLVIDIMSLILCPFLSWVILFLLLDLKNFLNKSWIIDLYWICDWHIFFFPFCGLFFHFLDNVLRSTFFFFLWYWGLELRPTPWATLPALFCNEFFPDRILWSIRPGWLLTQTLLICASWVARITCVRHWCQLTEFFIFRMFSFRLFLLVIWMSCLRNYFLIHNHCFPKSSIVKLLHLGLWYILNSFFIWCRYGSNSLFPIWISSYPIW